MKLSEQIYNWLADGKPQSTSDYYTIRQWGEAAEALEAENEKLKLRVQELAELAVDRSKETSDVRMALNKRIIELEGEARD